MMKKSIVFLPIMLFMYVFSGFIVYADDAPPAIKVYIDGQQLNFDVDPINQNGTTMVQFRPIFEKLGLNVKWDNATQTVTGTKGSLQIKLTIGKNPASVNFKPFYLPELPEIIEGNTFVPLRFVAESTGMNVDWDQDAQSVYIGKHPVITDNGYTFRNTKWGASMEQVKNAETEGTLLGTKEGRLIYDNVTVAGKKFAVAYEFVNDTLVEGYYVYNEDHINDNDYISDFNSLKQSLTGKYGKPNFDQMVWKGDLWKGDTSHYGTAVATGDLSYLTEWDAAGNTSIKMVLSGDNFKISLVIVYEGKDYINLIQGNDSQKSSVGL